MIAFPNAITLPPNWPKMFADFICKLSFFLFKICILNEQNTILISFCFNFIKIESIKRTFHGFHLDVYIEASRVLKSRN